MTIALVGLKVMVRGQGQGKGLGSKRGRWDLDRHSRTVLQCRTPLVLRKLHELLALSARHIRQLTNCLPYFSSLTKYRPNGGETVCLPRRWQIDGRFIGRYIHPD